MNNKNRLPGLDSLRAVAILLVLLSHYTGFVSHAPTFGFIGGIGWAGVDLFFVLSGYLIGDQLLAPVARGGEVSLQTFFARRLLRTLPAYYAVLAVYLLFPHSPISGTNTVPVWRFLTFTQNFGLAYGQTFTHSWSLCIEEQFYLVLPLAVLAMKRWCASVRVAWLVLLAAVAVGVGARSYAWLVHGHDSTAAEVYYSTFCRADELLFGVALAMIKNFHPGVLDRVLRRANRIFFIGLACVVAVLYALDNAFPSPFATTALGYSLVAACFALMTCGALEGGSLLNRWTIPGTRSLATWSYSVYLAHKPVFMVLGVFCKQRGIDPGSPAVILVIMGIGAAAGWILYSLVEKPFMGLRARWFPALAPGSPVRVPVTSTVA